MAAPRRLRMALLEHELAQVRFQYNLVLAAILEAAERERQRARRRERRWWVREWILRRALFGQYETLMKELEAEHPADFKAFLRMEPQMYYELLNRVGPRITKSTTCLLTTLEMRPSTVTKTVMACMTLHNLMRTRYPNIQNADLDREDEQDQFIAGAWRDQAVLEDVQAAGNGPYIYTSRDVRPGYGRVPAEHRPVSLTSVSHRYYTFQGSVPHRLELGRSSAGMHGTPADTRPCTGRRVFRCGYDGAAMRELGESLEDLIRPPVGKPCPAYSKVLHQPQIFMEPFLQVFQKGIWVPVILKQHKVLDPSVVPSVQMQTNGQSMF
ncbi:hypothetical protein MAR_009118 [Mya arenaria]|uniref:Nuclease HARBI1 n=1 Tax=Mya arenaria TaxID=6604 RepID=A0ABY7E0U3_MYAAR|nr:hypothetical protein MAR_009118 [Mya arenaria]